MQGKTSRGGRKQKHTKCRGTQREYSSKPHKHSIVERTVVFKR